MVCQIHKVLLSCV